MKIGIQPASTAERVIFVAGSASSFIMSLQCFLDLPDGTIKLHQIGRIIPITNSWWDVLAGCIFLMIGVLPLVVIRLRQTQSASQHQAELSAVLADLDNPAAWKA